MKLSARREQFLRQQLFARASRVGNRADFRREVIQTATPLRRALVTGSGIVIGTVAVVLAFIDGAAWFATLLGGFALLVIYIGLRGRRKSVDTVLRGLDASLSSSILDWLFPG